MTEKYQVLSVLVENSAGVLSQVTRMFSRKGFNIVSLAVGETDDPTVSRMTIIVHTDDEMIQQIASQLGKLLPVYSVKVLDNKESIRRELILVKLSAPDRETRDEIIQIVSIFRAKIIDVSAQTLTVEITGDHGKAVALLDMLRPFGILELVRTGTVALDRGIITLE